MSIVAFGFEGIITPFSVPKLRPFEKKVKTERQMMTDYLDTINIGECGV